ncbi:MAG: tripartite tricarboxylate transporter substrate binding protein [Proteobacteria bacterium]|nr:tripartite tricarboxylate transporter substrate binding protein [Burkholderiales bacterium]
MHAFASITAAETFTSTRCRVRGRSTLHWLPVALTLSALSGATSAQNFPAKAIRLISPFEPAGSNDGVARLIAPKLGELLGTSVLVENRPGAGGVIGTEVGAKALPDGYTLTVATTSTFSINPVLRKVSYDPLVDFATVGLIGVSPYVMLTHPSVPVKNVQDLVTLAKKRPGLVEYGSGGIGTPGHLAGAAFARQTGIEFTHIPYKSGASSIADLVGGRITLVFTTMLVADSLIEAGRLRALGVTTRARLPRFPNIPTIDESGLRGYEFTLWLGVVAPGKTPDAIVQRLSDALSRTLRDTPTHTALAGQSVEVLFEPPKDFTERIRRELVTYAKVIKESGAKVD